MFRNLLTKLFSCHPSQLESEPEILLTSPPPSCKKLYTLPSDDRLTTLESPVFDTKSFETMMTSST